MSSATNPLGWNFRTFIDSYAPRYPLTYAIDGLFSLPSMNVIFGAPGSLKSMFMADACVCVALGVPWLTGLIDMGPSIKTIQCNVMWIDFDNGEYRTDERFEALGRAYNASETTPLFYVSMATPWLNLTKTGMIMDLVTTINDMNIKFVVMDNLGVLSGDADENTTDMVPVMSNLRLLSERTGAAVTVIHHQRKMQGKGFGGGREGDSLRGHSSIEASLDLAMRIDRETNSESITVKATKTRGADVNPFGALFSFTSKKGTKELETARFYGLDIIVSTSDQAIIDTVLEAVENAPSGTLKHTEIVKAVKEELGNEVGRDRIRAIVVGMEARGELLCTTSSSRSHAKTYSIPFGKPIQSKTSI